MIVDWSRLAEPQLDGYDTEQLLGLRAPALVAQWDALAARVPSDAPRFCGARVGLAHVLAELPAPLVDGPLDHPHVAAAEALLALWPAIAAQLPRFVGCVHTARVVSDDARLRGASFSGSSRDDFGVIYATVEHPMTLAEALVHELAHTKLVAVGVGADRAERLIGNDGAARYPSPVLDVPRPMGAVVHAVYSFIHILQLDVLMYRAATTDEERAMAERLVISTHERMVAGVATVRDHAVLDDDGLAFMAGFLPWADRVVGEAGAIARQAS